jgi:pyridoxal phosphate enzyme (YggS family)
VAADPDAVRRAVDAVRARIEGAGGDPDGITIVAVTKGFGVDAVAAARDAGLPDIGENYAQELVAKVQALAPDVAEDLSWHFLGAVQRNKVASLAPHVSLWQSVDRPAAGRSIAARCPGARVLIEVNSGDPARPGCAPAAVPELAKTLDGLGLVVGGLMAVGPLGPPGMARPVFRSVTALANDLGLPERSIGMTDDLEIAVEEGTTMIRIGRALFGPRPGRGGVPG